MILSRCGCFTKFNFFIGKNATTSSVGNLLKLRLPTVHWDLPKWRSSGRCNCHPWIAAIHKKSPFSVWGQLYVRNPTPASFCQDTQFNCAQGVLWFRADIGKPPYFYDWIRHVRTSIGSSLPRWDHPPVSCEFTLPFHCSMPSPVAGPYLRGNLGRLPAPLRSFKCDSYSRTRDAQTATDKLYSLLQEHLGSITPAHAYSMSAKNKSHDGISLKVSTIQKSLHRNTNFSLFPRLSRRSKNQNPWQTPILKRKNYVLFNSPTHMQLRHN